MSITSVTTTLRSVTIGVSYISTCDLEAFFSFFLFFLFFMQTSVFGNEFVFLTLLAVYFDALPSRSVVWSCDVAELNFAN